MSAAVRRVRSLFRGDRVVVEARVAKRVRVAAQRALVVDAPHRRADVACIWADEGTHYIVAVYAQDMSPGDAPIFFAVAKADYEASVLDVTMQLKYRQQ